MNVKINSHDTNTNGTHLQGYINASYDMVTEALGYPLSDFDNYKSDAEWTIEFEDGQVATVYNWKNGKNYLGASGLNLCDITQWHIGGNHEGVVKKVQDLIKESVAFEA